MIIILLSILAVLNFLDAYTTHKIIKLGGTELNPIMNYVVSKLGVTGLYIAKVLATIMSLGVLLLHRNLALVCLVILVLFFYLLVLHNVELLRKLHV